MPNIDGRTEAIVNQAHKLVDHVIESAIRKLQSDGISSTAQNKIGSRQVTIGESVRFDLSRDTTLIYQEPPPWDDYDIENVEWLNIEDFLTERAEEKIHEFIKVQWNYLKPFQFFSFFSVEMSQWYFTY